MTSRTSDLRLTSIAVAVQHLYRDGELIADALGEDLEDGGWYPGTGVGHKWLAHGGVQIDVLSVVDYQASRRSDLGYAVYEAARLGSTLFELTVSTPQADFAAVASETGQTFVASETYRRADGRAIPSAPVLPAALSSSLRIRVVARAQDPAAPLDGSWTLRLPDNADVEPYVDLAQVMGLTVTQQASAAGLTSPDGRLVVPARDQDSLIAVRTD